MVPLLLIGPTLWKGDQQANRQSQPQVIGKGPKWAWRGVGVDVKEGVLVGEAADVSGSRGTTPWKHLEVSDIAE